MSQSDYTAVDTTKLVDSTSEYGPVLFSAEFDEEKFCSYRNIFFVLVSVASIPLYGMGILMLMFLPVMRHIWRRDIQRRRLFITRENVVYETTVPVICPCFGDNHREKHVLLGLVTDVVLEQGCLQARHGVWSVKVENAGQGNPNQPGSDLAIVGIRDAPVFKRVLLAAVMAKRGGMEVTPDILQQAVVDSSALTYGAVANPSPYGAPIGGQPHQQTVPAMAPMQSSLETLAKGQEETNAALGRIAQLLEAQVQQKQKNPEEEV